MKNLNFKMDKDQWKEIGNFSYKLGKKIVVEGVKSVALGAATKVITTSFDGGIDGVKKLDLVDDIIGLEDKKKAPKKKWFSKKEDKEIEDVLEKAEAIIKENENIKDDSDVKEKILEGEIVDKQ